MTDPASMSAEQLATACGEAMFSRDQASQKMGMRLLQTTPGGSRMQVRVREDMIQGLGACHGGYLFAFADSAFAFACNSYNRATVALDCTIDFIAPAFLGDELTISARELSRSGRTGTYAIEINNQNGDLIALFRGKSYRVRGSVLEPEYQKVTTR